MNVWRRKLWKLENDLGLPLALNKNEFDQYIIHIIIPKNNPDKIQFVVQQVKIFNLHKLPSQK